MNAYDPIPALSQSAMESAVKQHKKLQRTSPELIFKFESYFCAWQESWAGVASSASVSPI